jgi:hypothetical protein
LERHLLEKVSVRICFGSSVKYKDGILAHELRVECRIVAVVILAQILQYCVPNHDEKMCGGRFKIPKCFIPPGSPQTVNLSWEIFERYMFSRPDFRHGLEGRQLTGVRSWWMALPPAAFAPAPPTRITKSSTKTFICSAWVFISSEAEADSSALDAFC